MNDITTNPGAIGAEINKHHALAQRAAGEAVEHAREAGKLLLQMKAGMEHGQWLPWLAANVSVSERQARRYMRAAQGRPEIRKSATVTDLKPQLPAAVAAWPVPTWQPEPGHWHMLATDADSFHVVPALGADGFFHVSHLYGDLFDGTRRPVRGDVVEVFLRGMGMTEPAAVPWKAYPRPGLARPFGEPEGADYLRLREAA